MKIPPKLLRNILIGILSLIIAASVFSVSMKNSRLSAEYQHGIQLPETAKSIKGYDPVWILRSHCGTILTIFELPAHDFLPWLETLDRPKHLPYPEGQDFAIISEEDAEWFSIPIGFVFNSPKLKRWMVRSPVSNSSLKVASYLIENRRIVYLCTYLESCD
jgi:hypothetical protein